MKDDLVFKIIEIEWEMFSEVPNIGGPAPCQQDFKTFRIMRSSQFLTWSEDVLKSYLEDLIAARHNDENLLTYKYARIMEHTSQNEYANIANFLPKIDVEKMELINKIVEIILEWEKEISEKFPFICLRGRPIYSSEDNKNVISIETYLKGELSTYSLRTLKLYKKNIIKQKSNNINGSELNLFHIIKAYGYKSLEEANRKLKAD